MTDYLSTAPLRWMNIYQVVIVLLNREKFYRFSFVLEHAILQRVHAHATGKKPYLPAEDRFA